jgi:hypothetical protein
MPVSPVARPPDGFLASQERLTRKGTPRWRNHDGSRLYEWDAVHGHIEAYNRQGHHLGVLDKMTGEVVGPPKRGRRIDVN